jgi:hypothetical protein
MHNQPQRNTLFNLNDGNYLEQSIDEARAE